MKSKQFILISIPCTNTAQILQAKKAVLYHLESLNPELSIKGKTLIVQVIPIDPDLFTIEEACSIICQTLAQSLSFNQRWTCTMTCTHREFTRQSRCLDVLYRTSRSIYDEQ